MESRANANRARPRGLPIRRGLIALGCIALLLTSCGGGGRQLISLSVEPGDATASPPNGTFPFTATGTFDQAPPTQTNLPARWSSTDAAVATIDSNTGVATCVAIGGPVTVTASAAGKGGTLIASAKLTCQNALAGVCQVTRGIGRTLNGVCILPGQSSCQNGPDPANCPAGAFPKDLVHVFAPACGTLGDAGVIKIDASRSCNP